MSDRVDDEGDQGTPSELGEVLMHPDEARAIFQTELMRQALSTYIHTDVESSMDEDPGFGKGKCFYYGHRVYPDSTDFPEKNRGRDGWR